MARVTATVRIMSAPIEVSSLFEGGLHRDERGLHRGTDAVDGRDDHQRYSGGNDAVLDRGRAELVFQERRYQTTHGLLPLRATCRFIGNCAQGGFAIR